MKTRRLRKLRWAWALALLLASVLPISYAGFDGGIGGADSLSAPLLASTWRSLASSAHAKTSDDYLFQTESAMRQIDGHMNRLSRRATTVDPLTRCSFEGERRRYYEQRDALRREIQQARAGRPGSIQARQEVERRLDELQNAYARALSCYR